MNNFLKIFFKKLYLIIILTQFANLSAQSSQLIVTKTYGFEFNDRGTHILPTNSGGYMFLGTLFNMETKSEDMWLVELDSTGKLIWQEIYGGSFADRGSRLIADSSGGFLLVGYTQSYGTGGFDAWLVKVNSAGIPQWQKTFGDSLDDYAFDAIQVENGEFIIAGTTTSIELGKFDFWVFRVDSEGNIEWETILGEFDHDQARSIKQTADGDYIVTGYTVQDLETTYDLWLVKLDSNGDSLWSKIYGGSERDAGISIQEISDDKLMVLGYTESYSNSQDIWIIITDSEGNPISSSSFGGDFAEYGHILNKTNDGNYIITGYTESFGSGGWWDLLILKVDSSGNEIWSNAIGGEFRDYGQYIYQDESDNFVCIGITESFGSGQSDAWVLWADSLGQIIPPVHQIAPYLSNITDVPNDQGGWVKVEFYRSSYDTDSLTSPKTSMTELYTVEINDGSGWTASASTAAYGKLLYSVLVPTTKDSTSESNEFIDFRVIAAMNEGNYVSNVASGYSVDNLTPAVPTGIAGSITEDSNIQITWQSNSEPDFSNFTIYRSQDGVNFKELGHTVETNFIDTEILVEINYSYAVTATDFSGNESNYSDVVTLSITNIESISSHPIHYYLSQNYPNPFNPQTTIKYGIRKAGKVNVIIYDILGNIVKELVNQRKSKGHHQVVWNGTNSQNRTVSSGIYYYQIVTQDFQDIKKMSFLR